MQWSPHVKLCFSDEELVQNLVSTHDRPERRTGNWWTFFTRLCRHEQAELIAESERRWSSTFVPPPVEAIADDASEHLHNAHPENEQTIQILSQIAWH